MPGQGRPGRQENRHDVGGLVPGRELLADLVAGPCAVSWSRMPSAAGERSRGAGLAAGSRPRSPRPRRRSPGRPGPDGRCHPSRSGTRRRRWPPCPGPAGVCASDRDRSGRDSEGLRTRRGDRTEPAEPGRPGGEAVAGHERRQPAVAKFSGHPGRVIAQCGDPDGHVGGGGWPKRSGRVSPARRSWAGRPSSRARTPVTGVAQLRGRVLERDVVEPLRQRPGACAQAEHVASAADLVARWRRSSPAWPRCAPTPTGRRRQAGSWRCAARSRSAPAWSPAPSLLERRRSRIPAGPRARRLGR